MKKSSINFFYKAKLLSNFYQHYGHSNVPVGFKTKDGINIDLEGIDLYSFISALKAKHNGRRGPFTELELELIEKVGLNFEKRKSKRSQHFEALKNYSNYHGDCNVPRGFKTNDGITVDKNGIDLGAFVVKLRRFARGLKGSLTESEYIFLLEINFDFESLGTITLRNYNMLIQFYKHYGHTDVPLSFKTLDGINEHENGENLGYFVLTLKYRIKYALETFSELELSILEKINLEQQANVKILNNSNQIF